MHPSLLLKTTAVLAYVALCTLLVLSAFQAEAQSGAPVMPAAAGHDAQLVNRRG